MAIDISDTIIKMFLQNMLGGSTPEEKEASGLRLKALKQGQSPTQGYKVNIDEIAGNYKDSIDSDAIGDNLERLKDYKTNRLLKDKNLQPIALDYVDNTLKNMENRNTTISSFNTFVDELANIENDLDNAVNIYMASDDPKRKSNAIDSIKKINESRMDRSNKLKSIDGKRYHNNVELKSADAYLKIQGAFAIDAIHSDGLMDKYEHGIWQNAIDSDNPDIINQYYSERLSFKDKADKSWLEGFSTSGSEAIQAYANWQDSIANEMPIDAQQKEKDLFNDAKFDLYTLKGQMEDSMGFGKVNYMWNSIFPDDVPWPKVDKKQEEKTDEKKVDEEVKVEVEEVVEEDKQTYASISTKEDAEQYLIKYLNGEISDKALRRAGGQSLVNNANRIKDAYKGEYAGRKSRKSPIKDIETLKGITYGHQSYKHSWDDVIGDIFKNKNKFVTDTEVSTLTDEFLSYVGNISDFLKNKNIKVMWRKNRKKIEGFKKKFEQTNLSIEEYKKEYPSHYEKIKNALALRRT